MNALYKTLYYLFLGLVLALGLLLATSLVPIPGNIQIKIVQSGSMEPAIKTGAIAILKPANEYRVGDVVTFGEDTKTKVPTTHRIVADRVASGEFLYTTKGDANEDPDPKEIKKKDIIGKVLFSVPYLGFLLDFARKPLGFALLIGLPAGIVIIDEGIKIWKEIALYRRKKIMPEVVEKENNDKESNS